MKKKKGKREEKTPCKVGARDVRGEDVRGEDEGLQAYIHI